jgi:tripartite-type tricarboxylate transporter receptor subunit TctC
MRQLGSCTRTKRSLLIQIGTALMGAMVLLPNASFAQVPGRTITIIVPQTPGTGPAILARVIGSELRQKLAQPVVVENIPGASGNIGTAKAAHAPPDGNTLLMHTTPLVTNAGLFNNHPWLAIERDLGIVME